MNIRIEVKKAVPGSKRTEYLKTWEKLCIV